MAPLLLIHPDLSKRVGEIEKILGEKKITRNHPNLLWITDEEKLGVEQAKKIREHLTLKPYQDLGQIIVLESAHNLTTEAQNSLLKILEEPPEESLIILGINQQDRLLPTVLSRCQIHSIDGKVEVDFDKFQKDIEELEGENVENRFKYIEKLEDKESFLNFLTHHFREKLIKNPSKENLEFSNTLIEANKWADRNVNIRAILEYLMLLMPLK